MQGLKIAALFGFEPHKLGFCGPKDSKSVKILFDFICGKNITDEKIRNILKRFESAFSYYKLIAKSNKIKDPFNEKVVMAYWVGNKLLENIPVEDLRKLVNNNFSKKSVKVFVGDLAHHSFHVLKVGSITGRVKLEGKLLDLCCVNWGRVIKKSKVRNSRSKVLIQDQNQNKKQVFWDKNLVPKLKIGDSVAVHWNHIIMIITKQDAINLTFYDCRFRIGHN